MELKDLKSNKDIKAQAELEIYQEEFRRQVEEMKVKLKAKRNFWSRIFPFKIVIIRREKL